MSTMTKLITDLRKRLLGATGAVHDEVERLRGEIARTHRALQHAQHGPRPLEEIIETRIPEAVRLSAELWSARNGQSVIYGERCLASPDAGSPRLPWQYGEPLPWGALATARPDLAASILEGLVRQVEYVPGPSSAERPALIAKLQRDLAALEATELALLDEAAASGVMIQHRPEVAAARADEAERRRREQEAATARQAREAAIDRQHAEAAGRGRAVRSAYVESGRVDRSPK